MIRDDREVLTGRVSAMDYRRLVARMYGFHAAIERALAATRQLAAVLPDAGLRNHKAALLAHDLLALGVEPRELIQLPRMPFAGTLTLPEALGWQYVVESLTLNGKQLVRHLARQLPAEVQRAAAYFGCYGDEVAERFRGLCQALDAFEASERDVDRIIATARDGFLQLRAWTDPVALPRPSRIHA